MEFDDVLFSRRSVRTFKSKKPEWKRIMDAIEAATNAPFAGNMNHLKFVIVEEQEKINALADIAHQNWIAQSSTVVAVCSDDAYLENTYGERGRIYARQQAGAAIENFLLKIVDMGLSACWVGAYTDELVKTLLMIPPHIQIEALIPIGYEAGKTPKKEKRSLESVIFWDVWFRSKRTPLAQDPLIHNYK